MPQWNYPNTEPYSIYACEQPYIKAPHLTPCGLREPLQSPDHIRLLKLYPPGWSNRHHLKVPHEEDTAIRCDIFQVQLSDITTKGRPYFATLSYAWDRTKASIKIRCGNKSVAVSQSLHDALVYIRHQRRPRLLWVDSLCINQKDEHEKSEQVRRMYLIYGQSHCVSWLGVETESKNVTTMKPVLEIFYRMNEWIAKQSQRGPLWDMANFFYGFSPFPEYPTLNDIPWQTLNDCLDWPIFDRIWCTQEVILARSNDIRTSRTRLDMTTLAKCCYILRELLSTEWTPSGYGQGDRYKPVWIHPRVVELLRYSVFNIYATLRVDALYGIEFKKGKVIKQSPTVVPLTYRWKNCSDPRDFIYGLTALCGFGLAYETNYSHPIQQVFIDFILHQMKTNKNLWHFRLLWHGKHENHCQIFDGSTGRRSWVAKLPSWCPQFSGPIYRKRLLSRYDNSRRAPLRACKGRPCLLTRLSPTELGVIGIFVGSVQRCGLTLYQRDVFDDEEKYQQCFKSRRASWNHLLSSETRIPAQSLWRTYCDVCMAGCDIRCFSSWTLVAPHMPPKTRDRMAMATLGPVWLEDESPSLMASAGLTISRKINPEIREKIQERMEDCLTSFGYGCRLFTTSNVAAILGTGPSGMHVGDIVTVLFGSDVPIILREVGNKGQYKVIGECYVSGIMHGEALKWGLEEREFLLI